MQEKKSNVKTIPDLEYNGRIELKIKKYVCKTIN